MLVQHGLKSGKYSSLIRPSLFVLMSKYWLFFAFWGLTLEISGCFHYLSLILQNDIRPYKVDEMTYILCLTEWWSFISSIWVTTTINRQWSISETLNSLTRKLLLFTFLFVFHSLSKLFNLKLLSNSWKQISRKLPKLKNLRNFHQTTHKYCKDPRGKKNTCIWNDVDGLEAHFENVQVQHQLKTSFRKLSFSIQFFICSHLD